VPERAQGYQFEYEIHAITRLGATLRYTERIYKPGADDFEVFKETTDIQLMTNYPMKDVETAHDLWHIANAKINERLYHERERLKKAQQSASVAEQEDYSTADIEEFFIKHGKGSHMLEYDYEADTPEPVPYKKADGKMSIYQNWTHKHTKFTVKRYAAANGRDVDSGRLSKYLRRIKQTVHPLAYIRAKKILELNDILDVPHSSAIECVPTPLGRVQLLKQQVSEVFVLSFCCHSNLTFCVYHVPFQIKAVLMTVEAGTAAVSLHGVYAKRFFRVLNPLHNPPHRLMYMRIVRLLELAFFREYRRLIDDNVLWLGSNFA
jgi:hypothetical protein